MMLHQPTPKSLAGQLNQRIKEIWCAHPVSQISVGDVAPVSQVMNGEMVIVMVAKGPLMISKYTPRERTQWLFDSYGR